MGILTVGQFLELENEVVELFDTRSAKFVDYMSQIFNVQDTDVTYEKHIAIGEFAIMTPWGGTVNYDGFSKGHDVERRVAKYSTGVQFEDAIFRYRKQYGQIAERVNKAATGVYKTVQTYAASVFNNAFTVLPASGNIANPDAVALCSASHTYSPTDPTVQGNTGVLDLDVANLDATIDAMANFKDDRGDLLTTVLPNILMVGNSQARLAKKLIGSDKEAFVNDNTVNLFKGELQVIVNPFITGKKWFVADGMAMADLLTFKFGRRAKPEKDSDFDTEVYKFKLVTEFMFGFDDWRFIYGQNPA